MIACELEPQAAATLMHHLQRDSRIKCLQIDGWMALSAYVPPKERRGLVLIDPPFEQENDFARLATGLAAAHRKWATGIYALWYPIKGRSEADALAKRLKRLGIGKILRAELIVSPLSDPTGSQRLRYDHRQSAMDARKRAVSVASRTDWYPGTPRQGPFHARLARRRCCCSAVTHWLFSQAHTWCVVHSLAVTFRLLVGGPADLTEGRSRLTLSPSVNVRPSRRAWGRRRSRGERSFPDGTVRCR